MSVSRGGRSNAPAGELDRFMYFYKQPVFNVIQATYPLWLEACTRFAVTALPPAAPIMVQLITLLCVERALLPACLQFAKTSGQECPLHVSKASTRKIQIEPLPNYSDV